MTSTFPIALFRWLPAGSCESYSQVPKSLHALHRETKGRILFSPSGWPTYSLWLTPSYQTKRSICSCTSVPTAVQEQFNTLWVCKCSHYRKWIVLWKHSEFSVLLSLPNSGLRGLQGSRMPKSYLLLWIVMPKCFWGSGPKYLPCVRKSMRIRHWESFQWDQQEQILHLQKQWLSFVDWYFT